MCRKKIVILKSYETITGKVRGPGAGKMNLNANTKIGDLLESYPFLLDFLVSKSPKFKHLENPLMRKTLGKVATLERAAATGQIELEGFISDIARQIREKTGETVQVQMDSSSPEAMQMAFWGSSQRVSAWTAFHSSQRS